MEILIDFPAVIPVIVTLRIDQILDLIVPHSTIKELFTYALVLAINQHW
jgi:hypothetical protein